MQLAQLKLKFVFLLAVFAQSLVGSHNLIMANVTESKNEDIWDWNTYMHSVI